MIVVSPGALDLPRPIKRPLSSRVRARVVPGRNWQEHLE